MAMQIRGRNFDKSFEIWCKVPTRKFSSELPNFKVLVENSEACQNDEQTRHVKIPESYAVEKAPEGKNIHFSTHFTT